MIKVNYWLNLGIICLLASKRRIYFLFCFRKDKSDKTMLVLLSCAKTMSETSRWKFLWKRFPISNRWDCFADVQFSVDELERLLRVNAKIAVENYKRYQAFHAEKSELPTFWLIRNCIQTVECKRFLERRIWIYAGTLRLTSFVTDCWGLWTLFVPIGWKEIVLPELGNRRCFLIGSPVWRMCSHRHQENTAAYFAIWPVTRWKACLIGNGVEKKYGSSLPNFKYGRMENWLR